jgi:Domain of unknown function (DUF4333)
MIASGRVAVALVALAALTACAKVATVDSVEEQIKSQLGTDSSDCPTDLQGEQGQSIVCKATKGAEAFDVKVTVTSVAGDTINFTIERVGGPPAVATPAATPDVDTDTGTATAPKVEGRSVAQSVLTQLAADGKQVDEVSCPDLAAEVGATQRCTLKAGADTYGVTVTVTTVQGTDVKFDIQVDQTPISSPSR